MRGGNSLYPAFYAPVPGNKYPNGYKFPDGGALQEYLYQPYYAPTDAIRSPERKPVSTITPQIPDVGEIRQGFGNHSDRMNYYIKKGYTPREAMNFVEQDKSNERDAKFRTFVHNNQKVFDFGNNLVEAGIMAPLPWGTTKLVNKGLDKIALSKAREDAKRIIARDYNKWLKDVLSPESYKFYGELTNKSKIDYIGILDDIKKTKESGKLYFNMGKGDMTKGYAEINSNIYNYNPIEVVKGDYSAIDHELQHKIFEKLQKRGYGKEQIERIRDITNDGKLFKRSNTTDDKWFNYITNEDEPISHLIGIKNDMVKSGYLKNMQSQVDLFNDLRPYLINIANNDKKKHFTGFLKDVDFEELAKSLGKISTIGSVVPLLGSPND